MRPRRQHTDKAQEGSDTPVCAGAWRRQDAKSWVEGAGGAEERVRALVARRAQPVHQPLEFGAFQAAATPLHTSSVTTTSALCEATGADEQQARPAAWCLRDSYAWCSDCISISQADGQCGWQYTSHT